MSRPPRRAHLLPLVLLPLLAVGPVAAASSPEEGSTGPARPAAGLSAGFSEAVVVTDRPSAVTRYLLEVGGWHVAGEADCDPAWVEALGGAGGHRERWLAAPGSRRGLLHVVSGGAPREENIRSNAHTWDTGGVFDLNVRVDDAWRRMRLSREHGWLAFTDPVDFVFGPFHVREVLVRGREDAALALIERVAPALGPDWHTDGFSRLFNSTQIVTDLDRALSFYRDGLGMKVYLEHEGASEEGGANVLGLPPSVAEEVSRRVTIVSPDGGNEGSIELLQFVGLPGRDLSSRVSLRRQGLLSLRFPVRRLDELLLTLASRGTQPAAGPLTLRLPRHGTVRWALLRAPDGALLELFEGGSDSLR